MARANKGYEIRPMVCDWALDIPMGDTTFVLYFNSRNNAELVKAVLEWEDAHPNEATPYQPTLTPPNEPLTLEELLRMDGAPVWLDVAGGLWALVDALDGCLWLDRGGSIDIAKFAGKAYRRPPEGEEDT